MILDMHVTCVGLVSDLRHSESGLITGSLAISVPTFMHGRNFQFHSVSGLRGVALAFSSKGHRFEVRIALAPPSDPVGIGSGIPVLGLAHI